MLLLLLLVINFLGGPFQGRLSEILSTKAESRGGWSAREFAGRKAKGQCLRIDRGHSSSRALGTRMLGILSDNSKHLSMLFVPVPKVGGSVFVRGPGPHHPRR